MIQFLRGNASTLQSSQQVFLPGQPIFEQDTGQLKIGNGSDIYSALKYVGASSSDIVTHELDNYGWVSDVGNIRFINYRSYLSDYESPLGGGMTFNQNSATGWYTSNASYVYFYNDIPYLQNVDPTDVLNVSVSTSLLSAGNFILICGDGPDYGSNAISFNVMSLWNPNTWQLATVEIRVICYIR